VRPLHEFSEIFSNEDTIYVEFYGEDIDKIISLAEEEFNIPEGNISIFKDTMPPVKMEIPTNLKLIVLILVLIVILTSCEIDKRMKEIGVRKLNGNSIKQVIKVLLGKFIIAQILIFLLSVTITYAILVKDSFHSY